MLKLLSFSMLRRIICSIPKMFFLDMWFLWLQTLTFATLSEEKLKLTLKGKDITFPENITLTHSFRIRRLLEKIPGTFREETEDYLADSVESRYYTPSDFLVSKFKHPVSILYINVASSSAHIEDLRGFLNTLHNKFDIIVISKTKC